MRISVVRWRLSAAAGVMAVGVSILTPAAWAAPSGSLGSSPNTPTDLMMQNGVLPCVQGADRPWVYTATPQLQGQVSHPDGGMLDVSFELDRGPADAPVPGTHQHASTVVGLPGHNLAATAQLSVPAGWIPSDGTYSWSMSASDGTSSSPRSVVCEFSVDSAVPLTPSVAMIGTPPQHRGDKAEFGISVNMATAGLYDIDHFIYTTDGSEPSRQGSPSVPATEGRDASGNPVATADLTVTAANVLGNYIKVKAVNKTGTPGPVATCVDGNGLDGRSCTYNALPRG